MFSSLKASQRQTPSNMKVNQSFFLNILVGSTVSAAVATTNAVVVAVVAPNDNADPRCHQLQEEDDDYCAAKCLVRPIIENGRFQNGNYKGVEFSVDDPNKAFQTVVKSCMGDNSTCPAVPMYP
jgi:hypothetical protein